DIEAELGIDLTERLPVEEHHDGPPLGSEPGSEHDTEEERQSVERQLPVLTDAVPVGIEAAVADRARFGNATRRVGDPHRQPDDDGEEKHTDGADADLCSPLGPEDANGA